RAWPPPCRSPTRSRSAVSSPASPAASTPPRTRRSPSTTTCARRSSSSPRPRPPSTASSCSATSARRVWSRSSRRTRSPAPACRWARTPRSPPARWVSPARTRTSWPPPATGTWPPPTTRASRTTWSPRPSAWRATTTCAPTRPPRRWPRSSRASAVLLASEEWAEENKLPVRAYLVDSETAAVDFVHGHDGRTPDGLLMAPTYAVPRLLERNGLTLQDFDFYEIHEAFASQVLATLAGWESDEYCTERLGLDKALGSIDRSKLNVNGSSLAAGHPFAATGGRILAAAAKLLEQK